MTLTVEPLKNTDDWREYEKNSSYASFFHSLEWRDFIKETRDLEPNYFVARNDADQVVGLYPGFISKLKNFNFHESIPFADYGGPLCNDEYVGFAFQEYFRKMYPEMGIDYLKLCLTNGAGYLPSVFKSNLSVIQKNKGVMEVSLNSPDPELLINELVFSSSLRRKIRRLDNSPFKAINGTSIKDLKTFYDVYRSNLSFIGAQPWDYPMVEAIWRKFYPNNLRLWLMGDGNKVAGGLLVLKNHHGSFLKLLGINRDVKLSFPVAKYLFWKETFEAAVNGSKKVSFGSTPSNPADVHHLIKLSVGGTFKPQEIVWFPLSPKGSLLLQTRSKTEAGWLRIRDSLPQAIKMSIQNRLIKL
jgi:hypothetical protein